MRAKAASCVVAFACTFLLVPAGCSPGLRIVDTPISFSEERTALTKDYVEAHYGLTPPDIRMVPRIIVLHWTAIDDFEASFNAFDRETLPGRRSDIKSAGQVNVSVQFLVDREGRVHRLMPETRVARHVIGLNYSAVGVENVGGAGGVDNLTDAQIEANVALVRYLAEKYSTIEYLIGHHEYQLMEGHPLWREQDPDYRTQKVDPGARFMRAVRSEIGDLALKGPSAIILEARE
jgi:N-acetyl-anhydromuramyl-L-alanine amidase AmpD